MCTEFFDVVCVERCLGRKVNQIPEMLLFQKHASKHKRMHESRTSNNTRKTLQDNNEAMQENHNGLLAETNQLNQNSFKSSSKGEHQSRQE